MEDNFKELDSLLLVNRFYAVDYKFTDDESAFYGSQYGPLSKSSDNIIGKVYHHKDLEEVFVLSTRWKGILVPFIVFVMPDNTRVNIEIENLDELKEKLSRIKSIYEDSCNNWIKEHTVIGTKRNGVPCIPYSEVYF